MLDHSVIAAAVVQWRSSLSAMILVSMVDILNTDLVAITFWCVLFVLLIPLSVILFDICAKS